MTHAQQYSFLAEDEDEDDVDDTDADIDIDSLITPEDKNATL